MAPTAAPLTGLDRAVLVDGPLVETQPLNAPVGVDVVLEARGRGWHVIGVVRRGDELAVLCVPDRR